MFADHEVEVETAGVHGLALAVDRVAATEIGGALIAAAVVALVRTVRVRAVNHVRAASLRIGRKTVVPSPGENFN